MISRIYPPCFNDTFLQWMSTVHDWVISRQPAGSQIPAWHNAEGGNAPVKKPQKVTDGLRMKTGYVVWGSAWPFSTMGWAGCRPATSNVTSWLQLGNRLWHHLLSGCLVWSSPIFERTVVNHSKWSYSRSHPWRARTRDVKIFGNGLTNGCDREIRCRCPQAGSFSNGFAFSEAAHEKRTKTRCA